MNSDLFEYSDILNSPFQVFSINCDVVRPHWHYFTEIVYVVNGTIQAEVLEKKYTANEGDILIFHAKQIHSFKSIKADFDRVETKNDPKKIPIIVPEKTSDQKNSKESQEDHPLLYVIKYHEMIAGDASNNSPSLSRIVQSAANNEKIPNLIKKNELGNFDVKNIFETCLLETKTWSYGFDIVIRSQLNMLLTKIIRYWQKFDLNPWAVSKFDQFSTKEFSVLEYIDSHSNQNISIESLAEKCGMCYSNFAKQFKNQFGRTCKEYIEFVRICKADSLLLYTDKTLDFISQETGFTDSSHFIRTYKKLRGITPKQRRKS